MRRAALLFLALISGACAARAETRPHYGGTLRVEMQSTPNALALPDALDPAAYWDLARVLALVGDTLVRVDAEDRPQPGLATAWQHDSSERHWQFTLRGGTKFHDGSVASAAAIAKILGELHPGWSVRAALLSSSAALSSSLQTSSGLAGARISGDGSIAGESVTIDTDTPVPWLLAELALPRNLILTRNASGIPIGTGPFRVTDFQAGKLVKLVASDESRAGRPFVDAVEIEFGKSLREQSLAFELGRADLVESVPESASGSGRGHSSSSLPVELMALVFAGDSTASSPAASMVNSTSNSASNSDSHSKTLDARLREAIALSIDRKPIQMVLLKGAAEPTASILPNWMTGYGAAFSTQPNVARAKALLAESRPPALRLSYDPRDPQAQLIAERLALNAREAGITIQVSLSGAEDIRLVRIAITTPDPGLALREAARELGLAGLAPGEPVLRGNSVDDLYSAEHTLLEGNAVIPLFHLPVASTVSARVRGWSTDRLGLWDLADIWLGDSR
jgi:peptide/nickel transport system substrate-binding protein